MLFSLLVLYNIILTKPMSLNRKGFLVSKQLVQAIAKIEAENIFGRLEPGQILTQESLARTLMQIADIDKLGKL